MRRATLGAALVLLTGLASACAAGSPASGPPATIPPETGLPETSAPATPAPEAPPTPAEESPASPAPGAERWQLALDRGAPPDAPAVLASEGQAVLRWRAGEATQVGSVEPAAGLVVGDGEGTLVVERWAAETAAAPATQRGAPPEAEGLELLTDGSAAPLTQDAPVVLLDMALREGRAHVLYARRAAAEGGEPAGDVVLHDVAGAAPVPLTAAYAPEFGVYAASAAAGVVVASAWSDLTEAFVFVPVADGAAPDFADPTDELPYNAPPWLGYAVLAPDGQRLAYLSGPDSDGLTQEQTGAWELVVATRTGEELLRLPLAERGLELTHLDFDGRWALVSSATSDPGAAEQAPLLIDTATAEQPVGYVLDGLIGRATLDVAVAL